MVVAVPVDVYQMQISGMLNFKLWNGQIKIVITFVYRLSQSLVGSLCMIGR
jgi:hypothetical protein